VLDLDKKNEETCVRAWVEDKRDGDLDIRVVSSIAQLNTVHVKLLCVERVAAWLSRSCQVMMIVTYIDLHESGARRSRHWMWGFHTVH
jgi:hypothetical protein